MIELLAFFFGRKRAVISVKVMAVYMMRFGFFAIYIVWKSCEVALTIEFPRLNIKSLRKPLLKMKKTVSIFTPNSVALEKFLNSIEGDNNWK